MADIQVVKLLRALMSSELFRPVHLAPDAAEGVAEGAAVEDPVEEAASVVEISPETVASSPPATPEPKKSRRRKRWKQPELSPLASTPTTPVKRRNDRGEAAPDAWPRRECQGWRGHSMAIVDSSRWPLHPTQQAGTEHAAAVATSVPCDAEESADSEHALSTDGAEVPGVEDQLNRDTRPGLCPSERMVSTMGCPVPMPRIKPSLQEALALKDLELAVATLCLAIELPITPLHLVGLRQLVKGLREKMLVLRGLLRRLLANSVTAAAAAEDAADDIHDFFDAGQLNGAKPAVDASSFTGRQRLCCAAHLSGELNQGPCLPSQATHRPLRCRPAQEAHPLYISSAELRPTRIWDVRWLDTGMPCLASPTRLWARRNASYLRLGRRIATMQGMQGGPWGGASAQAAAGWGGAGAPTGAPTAGWAGGYSPVHSAGGARWEIERAKRLRPTTA
eukprot:g412.t1